ncbi:MAG TPA: YHYH protein [Tepidisphaeraceae bacterium]|nr:YHYH protein [Tepidisphaeraceae bacterium]
MSRRARLAAALFAAAVAPVAAGCPTHLLLGLQEPTGVWPTFSAGTTAFGPALDSPALDSIADPAVTAWRQNLAGVKGTSAVTAINNVVGLVNADVQTVAYSATHVYVKTTGVPSHAVGPFGDGNPAIPTNRNRTVRLPRTPTANAGTKTSVGLGSIGVMVNGVAFYDSRDARSYNNQNVWHQNAIYFEAAGFDAAKGHPSPDMPSQSGTYTSGNYHYHQAPITLLGQIDPGNTGQHHSPIIGFAFDGFPIYGPYGYANADGSGGVERITSSYQTRNISQRTTLPDGTVLSAGQYGPSLATYPLGAYTEDFSYVASSGDLDQYNGRFAVTPEYPQGTYAYFLTVDAAGNAAYPYIIGPQYYGVVDTANLGAGSITVPADVTFYVVPEPGAVGVMVVGAMVMLRRRRASI